MRRRARKGRRARWRTMTRTRGFPTGAPMCQMAIAKMSSSPPLPHCRPTPGVLPSPPHPPPPRPQPWRHLAPPTQRVSVDVYGGHPSTYTAGMRCGRGSSCWERWRGDRGVSLTCPTRTSLKMLTYAGACVETSADLFLLALSMLTYAGVC
jgi:hypothetical protein